MKTFLIIGLGNEGEEYQNTRHNIGFEFLDLLAQKSKAGFSTNQKLQSQTTKAILEGKNLILAKPTTFVNLSGQSVAKLKSFFKAANEKIVVVHDDLDIEFGNFKISFAKNSGGHRGVESVIKTLKTNKFWRVRLGTANRKLKTARDNALAKKKKEVAGFVLAKFSPKEQAQISSVFKEVLKQIETVILKNK